MEKEKISNTCIRAYRDEQQILRCKNQVERIESTLPDVAQLLTLTGNEVRLKILLLLLEEGRLCVCDLSDILGMKIPAVSQHLRKLKDAQIVFTQRDGTVIYYQLSATRKEQIKALINMFVGEVTM